MRRSQLFKAVLQSKVLLAILALFLTTVNASYAQLACGNDGLNTSGQNQGAANRPIPNVSCAPSMPGNCYLATKEDYIPYPYYPVTAPTVSKKVKIRFMVPDPGTPTKKNFKPGDEAQLEEMVTWINDYFSHTAAPTKPQTNICGSCHIPDSRIQFELVGITFFNSREFTSSDYTPDLSANVVDGDSVLNIFLCYYGGPPASVSWVGYANPMSNINRYSFYADPNYNYIVFSNTYASNARLDHAKTFMHEVLHLYGFWHLSSIVGGGEICDENDPDYLADIFNTGSLKHCLQSGTFNQCAETSPDYPNVGCDNNAMAIRNSTWMSPMQMGIVHRESFLGRMSRYTYPRNAPDVYPWFITSDRTWDFPIRVYQDIRVKDGATLTISCEVQMPPGGRIVVEPGSKLIIDGGHITSYHAKTTWKGIEALGNNDIGSNPQEQGYVELKNGAIIENAWEGVQNFSEENGGWGGGMIKAISSSFYNCWRSVQLNTYNKFAYSGLNCSFDQIDFTVDEHSLQLYPEGAGDQFTAFDIKGGVIIKNCKFKNETPYSSQGQQRRSNGIYMVNSSAKISQNAFDAFRGGIYVTGHTGTPTRNAVIYDNNFNHITNNITVAANAYADVRGNTVTNMLPYPISTWPLTFRMGTGVYLDNARGAYVACANLIDGNYDNGPYGDMSKVGIVINNSNAFGATVKRNVFTDLFTGTQTQKNNPELNISCNGYEHNTYGLNINPGSSDPSYFLKNQGNGCSNTNYRAGNIFTNNTWDIYSFLQNQWHYYPFRSSLSSEQYPFSTAGNIFIPNCPFGSAPSDPNSQCDKPLDCARAMDPVEAGGIYNELIVRGLSNSEQAHILRGHIIRAYNDAGNMAALRSFLENENNDNARKLLIPLYIEMNLYSQAYTTLGMLTINDGTRKDYTDYYTLLATLKQEGRTILQLKANELATVRSLASGHSEVADFAKATLEYAYKEPWEHPIEMISSTISARPVLEPGTTEASSKLYDAVPNPAHHKTTIQATITTKDALKNPALIICDFMGNKVYQAGLKEGDNLIALDLASFSPGMYLYYLILNGKRVESKRLSVTR